MSLFRTFSDAILAATGLENRAVAEINETCQTLALQTDGIRNQHKAFAGKKQEKIKKLQEKIDSHASEVQTSQKETETFAKLAEGRTRELEEVRAFVASLQN